MTPTPDKGQPLTNRLYVGNLSFGTSEATLREALSADGRNAKEVHLVRGGKGRSRGFAFAEMESAEEAQATIEALHATELEGRTIKVGEARERSVRSSGFHDGGRPPRRGASRGRRRSG